MKVLIANVIFLACLVSLSGQVPVEYNNAAAGFVQVSNNGGYLAYFSVTFNLYGQVISHATGLTYLYTVKPRFSNRKILGNITWFVQVGQLNFSIQIGCADCEYIVFPSKNNIISIYISTWISFLTNQTKRDFTVDLTEFISFEYNI